MSSPNDRKMELERKKAKLAQIREEKKRKEEERLRQLLHTADGVEGPQGSLQGNSALADETEKILTELGISPHTPETPTVEKAQEQFDTPNTDQTTSPTTVYKTRGRVSLDKTALTAVDIMPKEQVLYSKTTQTTGEASEYAVHGFEWDDEFGSAAAAAGRSSASTGGGAAGGGGGATPSPVDEVFDVQHHMAIALMPHVQLVKPATEAASEKTMSDGNKSSVIVHCLSDEEKQKLFARQDFKLFLDKCSRILERALTEKQDNIFVDYSKDEAADEKEANSDAILSLNRIFEDEKWSKGRCVTSMDYSMHHPELLAVSYNNNEEAQGEPDGVVLVWNSKFKKSTPEYVFHCQSRVLSVSWAKFHPNLILGGTYSGQICLWDNRRNKRTPVQKSPLSAAAHTHPVYCMKVVGTQNAHNLVTVSTDGKLCSWSLDMLAKPLETIDLQLKQSKQVAAMCLDFAPDEVNNFLVGAEDGCAYAGCRHGQKAGVSESTLFEAHSGPVTGLACHAAPAAPPGDFSHLFLTSSFDWTVKLWNAREPKALCSFEDHSDYVMDVGWSPINPALFASVDCRGKLDLWHLNQDLELPQTTLYLPDDSSANKLLWLSSGHQIAVGDDVGRVVVFDVREKVANPRATEWTQLAKVLSDAKQSQIEAEELTQAMVLSSKPLH